MKLYLSRLKLNDTPSMHALKSLLNPCEPANAADAHHKLIWSVFSDSHSRKRDFLWRYNGNGSFMTLSARPPIKSELFCQFDVKEFEPQLKKGDKLSYLLRVNATRAKWIDHNRSQRVDVVMDLLHQVPSGCERASARSRLAGEAADAWMRRQGSSKGYSVSSTITEGYSTLELGRKRREGATFGVLDLRGEIEVIDSNKLIAALAQGFGRAKAWGCGLMLIRRAQCLYRV